MGYLVAVSSRVERARVNDVPVGFRCLLLSLKGNTTPECRAVCGCREAGWSRSTIRCFRKPSACFVMQWLSGLSGSQPYILKS